MTYIILALIALAAYGIYKNVKLSQVSAEVKKIEAEGVADVQSVIARVKAKL